MRTMKPLPVLHNMNARSMLRATAISSMILIGAANAHGQGLPPLAKELNPAQTALILVDFQYPFTSPDGANHRNVKKEMNEKHLLDRTVDLVRKAHVSNVVESHQQRRMARHVRARPDNAALIALHGDANPAGKEAADTGLGIAADARRCSSCGRS